MAPWGRLAGRPDHTRAAPAATPTCGGSARSWSLDPSPHRGWARSRSPGTQECARPRPQPVQTAPDLGAAPWPQPRVRTTAPQAPRPRKHHGPASTTAPQAPRAPQPQTVGGALGLYRDHVRVGGSPPRGEVITAENRRRSPRKAFAPSEPDGDPTIGWPWPCSPGFDGRWRAWCSASAAPWPTRPQLSPDQRSPSEATSWPHRPWPTTTSGPRRRCRQAIHAALGVSRPSLVAR